MTNGIADISLRKAARIAGLAYLGSFIFSTYGGFVSFGPEESTTTAINDMANELLFRSGIVSWIIVLISDAVAAWALYILLKPVNASLSLLSAWFRLIFIAFAGIALLNLPIALQLSNGADSLTAYEPGQLQAQTMIFLGAYSYGIHFSFVFFGLHILFLGYLIFKSSYIPRILGVLLIVASIGYQINSFANFFFPNLPDYVGIFLVPAIISEGALLLWLIFRGGKIEQQDNGALESA